MAAWLVAIMSLAWAEGILQKETIKKFGYLLISFLYLTALLFTKSRSGFLGFGVTFTIFWVVVFFIFKKRLGKISTNFVVFLGVALVTILIIGSPFNKNIFSLVRSKPQVNQVVVETSEPAEGGTESGEIRKIVWRGAINIWRAYPVFGTGVETFAQSYYPFRPIEQNYTSEWDFLYNKAHNEYLNILANTGALGFLTYLILIGFSTWQIIRGINSDEKVLGVGILAGYISILVTNFFGFSVVPVSILMWTYQAFVIPTIDGEKIKVKIKKNARYSYLQVFLFLLTGILVLVVILIKKKGDYFLINTNEI